MFHRSFSHLARQSMSWPTKMVNGNWLERSGQQIRSLSKSPACFNLVDKNDRFDKDTVYELSHYEVDRLDEQLDRLEGLENGRNRSTRKQQYQVGLSNDQRNQLNRLNRSNELDIVDGQNGAHLSYNTDPNSRTIERDYIRSIQPELPPTFNLATYANHLDIIKQLVKLGVNIRSLESNRELAKYLITLDFDKDVVPYLNFLVRCGLQKKDLGDFLTSNFVILQENLENLQKRFDYYQKMKFGRKQIVEMMLFYPKMINYPIDIVDAKLGYLQRCLKLKPVFVRKMLYNCPKILRTDKMHLEYIRFALIEQCGFKFFQMKEILINNPALLIIDNARVVGSFEYIFKNITQDLDLICKFADVLGARVKVLEERDQYLKKLGRAQYDPLKPLYVPLYAFLVEDKEFIAEFAKTHPEDMYKFLKTL